MEFLENRDPKLFIFTEKYQTETEEVVVHSLDAVGASQIFFHTQNLGTAYLVVKESKAILQYFQYDQCAAPQKLSKLSFSKIHKNIWSKNSNLIVKNKHNVG